MNQLNRYNKQILLSEIGEEGQRKLTQQKVVIAGVEALGSVIASTLVRAGVGNITLIDRDFVELDNLTR